MKAYFILVGTELLNGKMIDTNSIFMAEEINKYGIEIVGKMIVGDYIENIISAIDFAKKNSDLVILSGGLGPTIDDLTRDAIAKYLNKELIFNEEEFEIIKKKYINISANLPESNKRQAFIPEGATLIKNNIGAAPSFYIDGIVAFPGVPDELKDAFPNFLKLYAKENNLSTDFYIKDILFWGIPESKLEDEVLDIVKNVDKEICVEFLVKDFGIIIRFIASNKYKEKINEIKSKIYERVGKFIFGEDEDRIESLLYQNLLKNNLKISLAESCTGGLVSAVLVAVAGISKVYSKGYTVYSNEEKERLLGVKKESLLNHGAVSKEVVKEMLEGLDTETGIAISGIAGPEGGTNEKPVGTVFIGIKLNDIYKVEKYYFRGTRERVRQRAAITALNELRKLLVENFD